MLSEITYPLRMSKALHDVLKRTATEREEKFGRRVTVRSIILDALLSHDQEIKDSYLKQEHEED